MTAGADERSRRRTEIGAERRARMLARLVTAARTVFATQGIDMPVIDDFIAEAGVGRGTFYNYFKTKDDLLAVVLDDLRRERRADEEQIRSRTGDQAERLVVAVRLRLRRAREDPMLGRLLLQQAFQDSSIRRGPEADIRQAIEAGRFRVTDVAFATDLFFTIVSLGIQRALSDSPPQDLDELVATSILAGLGMDFDEARTIAHRPLPGHSDPDVAPRTLPVPAKRQRAPQRGKGNPAPKIRPRS